MIFHMRNLIISILIVTGVAIQLNLAIAAKYELTRNSVEDPKVIKSEDISL